MAFVFLILVFTNFLQTLHMVSERSGMGLQVGKFHSETTKLWPLIYVQNAFQRVRGKSEVPHYISRRFSHS